MILYHTRVMYKNNLSEPDPKTTEVILFQPCMRILTRFNGLLLESNAIYYIIY